MAISFPVTKPAPTAVRLQPTTRKMIVEFIGTFFLVFTVGAAVRSGAALAEEDVGSAITALSAPPCGHSNGGNCDRSSV